jgi:hypothetical protein
MSVYLIPVWLGVLGLGFWLRQRREAVDPPEARGAQSPKA